MLYSTISALCSSTNIDAFEKTDKGKVVWEMTAKNARDPNSGDIKGNFFFFFLKREKRYFLHLIPQLL